MCTLNITGLGHLRLKTKYKDAMGSEKTYLVGIFCANWVICTIKMRSSLCIHWCNWRSDRRLHCEVIAYFIHSTGKKLFRDKTCFIAQGLCSNTMYTLAVTWLASPPGQFFSLNDNENYKRNGWTNGWENRPGIHCRGSSANAQTSTQILGNRIRL